MDLLKDQKMRQEWNWNYIYNANKSLNLNFLLAQKIKLVQALAIPRKGI